MSFRNRYSSLERMLYRIVFASVDSQIAVADIEDRMFAAELRDAENAKPVFVTALPRSGTTLLLEMIAELPEFATHRYRDMPFVLCPMIGRVLSKPFRRTDAPMQRAHEDGIWISQNSPEAFEEMIWSSFWPDHYHSDRIDVWQRCDNAEFEAFFRSHMRKVIALRRKDTALHPNRYMSKNNMNIARLQSIHQIFPDAIVLVPFRDPLQHANSLLIQHMRFLEMNNSDAFSRIYMRGIGHFDFGANFKPIDFNHWLGNPEFATLDAAHLSYWIRYWIEAYRFVLASKRPGIHLVCYEKLCENEAEWLPQIARFLEVAPDSFQSRSQGARKQPPKSIDTSGIDGRLIEEAMDMYQSLCNLLRRR